MSCATIIQGDRISAAACFLPLTTNPLLVTELGTRHRAALGISEESDCVAIVVSEETGKVSVAAFGEIEIDVPLERVEHLLSERPDHRDKRSARRLYPGIRRRARTPVPRANPAQCGNRAWTGR